MFEATVPDSLFFFSGQGGFFRRRGPGNRAAGMRLPAPRVQREETP